MTDTETDPRAVSQNLLEITGQALMTRDFEAFASVFVLPHALETFDGQALVTTRAELHDLFVNMCDYLENLGVTDFIRECISATFKGDTIIEATHLSHLLRKGTRLSEPYPVFSTLEKIDGIWMVASGKYAIDSKSGSGRAISRKRTNNDPS